MYSNVRVAQLPYFYLTWGNDNLNNDTDAAFDEFLSHYFCAMHRMSHTKSLL